MRATRVSSEIPCFLPEGAESALSLTARDDKTSTTEQCTWPCRPGLHRVEV